MYGGNLRRYLGDVSPTNDLYARVRVSTYLQHGIRSPADSPPYLCIAQKNEGILAGKVATGPWQTHEIAIRFGNGGAGGILVVFRSRLKPFSSDGRIY